MRLAALGDRKGVSDDDAVGRALLAHLCRCTGWRNRPDVRSTGPWLGRPADGPRRRRLRAALARRHRRVAAPAVIAAATQAAPGLASSKAVCPQQPWARRRGVRRRRLRRGHRPSRRPGGRARRTRRLGRRVTPSPPPGPRCRGRCRVATPPWACATRSSSRPVRGISPCSRRLSSPRISSPTRSWCVPAGASPSPPWPTGGPSAARWPLRWPRRRGAWPTSTGGRCASCTHART